MHAATPAVTAAQAGGLILAAAGSGAMLWTSIAFIPALLKGSHPGRLRSWQAVHDSGTAFMPPLLVTAATIHGFLAYSARNTQQTLATRLYASAGVVLLSIIAYTGVVVEPASAPLVAAVRAIDDKQGKGTTSVNESESTVGLNTWRAHNFVRGGMALMASLLSGYATFA